MTSAVESTRSRGVWTRRELVAFVMAAAAAAQLPTRPAAAADAEPIDLVFDMDDVFLGREGKLRHNVKFLPEPVVWNRSFASRKGEWSETYLVDADTGAAFQALLAIPGVRISFYSAHHGERAEKVLPKIFLPDGRSLAQIAYRVLGFSDIVNVRSGVEDPGLNQDPAGEHGVFTSGNGQKKDLFKVVAGDHGKPPVAPEQRQPALLDNVLFADDKAGNVMPGQERNHIFVDHDLPGHPLEYVVGLIQRARRLSAQQGIALADAASLLQWRRDERGRVVPTAVGSDRSLYEEGRERLANAAGGKPGIDAIPAPRRGVCARFFGKLRSLFRIGA